MHDGMAFVLCAMVHSRSLRRLMMFVHQAAVSHGESVLVPGHLDRRRPYCAALCCRLRPPRGPTDAADGDSGARGRSAGGCAGGHCRRNSPGGAWPSTCCCGCRGRGGHPHDNVSWGPVHGGGRGRRHRRRHRTRGGRPFGTRACSHQGLRRLSSPLCAARGQLLAPLHHLALQKRNGATGLSRRESCPCLPHCVIGWVAGVEVSKYCACARKQASHLVACVP